MRSRVVAVTIAALLVIAPASAARADGLVPGDGFTGTLAPWFATGDLSPRVGNGELCVDVAGNTPLAWSSIVGVDGVPIAAGQSYELSFRARATSSAAPTIRVLVQQPVSPWEAQYEANPTLAAATTDYSYSFTALADLPGAQLAFQLGAAPADFTLCLADVTIVEQDAAPVEPETGTAVRVNQLGYYAEGAKRATVLADATEPLPWELHDADGAVLASGETEPRGAEESSGANVHVVDFSAYVTNADGVSLVVDGESSHPFDIGARVYDSLPIAALDYFYYARSGIEIVDGNPDDGDDYSRAAGHLGVAPNQGDTAVGCTPPESFTGGYTCDYQLDVSGGWYDAGDMGKYVVNGGIAVYQLQSVWERSKSAYGALADGALNGPEGGNGVPDVLDEARWELEFMLGMQVPAGEPLAGMVHHKVQDTRWTGLPLLPADDPEARELHRPSTAATLNLAAVAAQGSRLWERYDPAFAERLLEASRTAWAAAKATPDLYAPDADGNDGGGAYGDSDVSDEFYWAAAELLLTTGEPEFADAVEASPWATADLYRPDGFTWAATAALGRLDLATVESSYSGRDAARASVVALADRYLAAATAHPFGIPFEADTRFAWGSNSAILNNLVVIGTAFDLTHDERYAAATIEGMDYLLGRNALDTSYVTGFGSTYSTNQHSRWFAHTLDESLPPPPVGSLAGGPNVGLEDPVAAQAFVAGCAPQRCYLDDVQSYSTNEITVNWNSALAWVSTFVADQTNGETTIDGPIEDYDPTPWFWAIGAALVALGVGAFFVVRRVASAGRRDRASRRNPG